jgi:hypothetical protein
MSLIPIPPVAQIGEVLSLSRGKLSATAHVTKSLRDLRCNFYDQSSNCHRSGICPNEVRIAQLSRRQ